jgi:hypothetical protein
MDAKRALLDDPVRARPVAEYVRVRIDLVFGNLRLAPVEVARPVGTRGDAVPATDAPVVVDDDDPVGLLPGRLRRAGRDAGRILALLAGDGQIELVLGGHLVVVVEGVPLVEIDRPDGVLPLILEDADPVDLRVPRLVVLLDARVHAAPAADAARDVESVPEHDPVIRGLRAHPERLPVSLGVLALEAGDDAIEILRREVPEVRLEEGFEVERPRRAGDSHDGADRGAGRLQEVPPRRGAELSLTPFHAQPPRRRPMAA